MPAGDLTLLLLALQMTDAVTPLALMPSEAFTRFPIVPTLEGQSIIKNAVLIGAAMVVGAAVRGGRIFARARGRVRVDIECGCQMTAAWARWFHVARDE